MKRERDGGEAVCSHRCIVEGNRTVCSLSSSTLQLTLRSVIVERFAPRYPSSRPTICQAIEASEGQRLKHKSALIFNYLFLTSQSIFIKQA